MSLFQSKLKSAKRDLYLNMCHISLYHIQSIFIDQPFNQSYSFLIGCNLGS